VKPQSVGSNSSNSTAAGIASRQLGDIHQQQQQRQDGSGATCSWYSRNAMASYACNDRTVMCS
jgi:hypothetical protein